jgi:hypothetical protein
MKNILSYCQGANVIDIHDRACSDTSVSKKAATILRVAINIELEKAYRLHHMKSLLTVFEAADAASDSTMSTMLSTATALSFGDDTGGQIFGKSGRRLRTIGSIASVPPMTTSAHSSARKRRSHSAFPDPPPKTRRKHTGVLAPGRADAHESTLRSSSAQQTTSVTSQLGRKIYDEPISVGQMSEKDDMSCGMSSVPTFGRIADGDRSATPPTIQATSAAFDALTVSHPGAISHPGETGTEDVAPMCEGVESEQAPYSF